MFMTPDEARNKICRLALHSYNPNPRMIPNCVAEECAAYWKWADEGHQKGYCSITGKPEF